MTIPGTVPAIGETDLPRITRAIRNIYENGSAAGSSGRLTYLSSTALMFMPFNGNLYTANQTMCRITAGGITCASTSIRVDGVSTNLANSTAYFVSMNSSGVPGFWSTLNYSHLTDPTGVEVISQAGAGKADETLIGWCKTDGSAHFVNTAQNRLVASFFNRQPTNFAGSTGGAVTTSVSSAPTELTSSARANFWSWGDGMMASICGGAWNNTGSVVSLAQVGIDGSAVGQAGQTYLTNANDRAPMNSSYSAVLSEGVHVASIFGQVTAASTGSFNLILNGIVTI